MAEVWIVSEESHYIDDAWSSVDRVFSTKEKAEAYAKEMNLKIWEGKPVDFVVEEWKVL